MCSSRESDCDCPFHPVVPCIEVETATFMNWTWCNNGRWQIIDTSVPPFIPPPLHPIPCWDSERGIFTLHIVLWMWKLQVLRVSASVNELAGCCWVLWQFIDSACHCVTMGIQLTLTGLHGIGDLLIKGAKLSRLLQKKKNVYAHFVYLQKLIL